MTETVECAVVGAGVVGLACARALALAGREVVVLEASGGIGNEISSRSSEVIHAGIYYPAGSLKARLCVAGRERLYAYCTSRGIPHSRLGKLIVATSDAQLPALETLRQAAIANAVTDLELLKAPSVRQLEPALRCVAALLSPSTGILDSHAFMLSLLGEAEAHGAAIAFHSPLRGGALLDAGFRLQVGGSMPMHLGCRILLNSAGLSAQAVARSLAGFDPALVPPLFLAKGNYFTLAGPSPFRRLIYPMPEPAGLGVHVTLDLAGQARFGPDVEWIETLDYDVDPARGHFFHAAVRTYWPDLPEGALQPGYCGIRPKLQGPGAPAADFMVQGPETHGIAGLVNLYGIESPGLTASLALADLVVERLGLACHFAAAAS